MHHLLWTRSFTQSPYKSLTIFFLHTMSFHLLFLGCKFMKKYEREREKMCRRFLCIQLKNQKHLYTLFSCNIYRRKELILERCETTKHWQSCGLLDGVWMLKNTHLGWQKLKKSSGKRLSKYVSNLILWRNMKRIEKTLAWRYCRTTW